MLRIWITLSTAFILFIVLSIFSSSLMAAEVGLKIFVEKRCYTCHTIKAESEKLEKEKAAFAASKGVEKSSKNKDKNEKIGVDLSDIGAKRDTDNLMSFLKDPKKYFKNTPPCKKNAKKKYRKRFKGSPEDFDALVAYLAGLKYESQAEPDFESCLAEQ